MKPNSSLLRKFLVASLFSAVAFIGCKKDNSDIASPVNSTTNPVINSTTSSDGSSESGSASASANRVSNQNPTVKTGPDQTYSTAVSSITLDGSGSSDPDGSISSYLWTKESGSGGTITSASSATTTVTGLSAGQYRFRLKITDNKGASVSDTIHISNGSGGTTPPANQAPVVNAGSNQTISSSSTTLSGSATDADGTIASYLWTKISGNGGAITNPNAASTTVTGLATGSYLFSLKATDNAGASANKSVTITVSSATPPPNQAPVVNAGSNQTITLPVSSVTLSGSATDADGTIASYLWTKVSGTGGTISNPSSASTTVTGLSAGSYVFNLKATDNAGGTGNRTVTITVNAASTPPPAGYTLTFSSGYDTQADMLYGGNGQYGNGTISTTTYKTGPGSFYSRPAVISAGTRSEVQYTTTAQNPTEGAVEYDVMYEVVIPSNGCSLQWHPNTAGSSGSPYLMHDNGKFTWVVWNNGNNTYYPTGITIQTQHWYHLRVEYKFGSAAQGGYLRWFVDGAKVLDKANIQMGDGSGQYLKVGYNGWDVNSTNGRIYYDNLKIYKKA
jgi:hypothetical protein